jgi:hypothetical protein
MYEDQRLTGADIHFIRSEADFSVLSDVLIDHIKLRNKMDIKTYAIEPDTPPNSSFQQVDNRRSRYITWIPKETYTAPANIYVYGNKVAIVSHGTEIIGTIIESPQLAQAFKQLMNLIRVASPTLMAAKRKRTLASLFSKLPPVN